MDNLITVIIPFHNKIENLKIALNSVLNQTYQNFEIILINDASTKDTEEIKKISKKNKNIRLYNNKVNKGASFSRNKGIENAKGEYIAFLDSDDEWLSFKLETQLEFMLKNNLSFTYTSYMRRYLLKEKMKVIKAHKYSKLPGIAFKCTIATPTVMIKRNILNGLRFDDELKFGEDVVFWAKLSKNILLKGINIPTAIVNVTNKSSSLNFNIQKKGFQNINHYLLKKNSLNSLMHKFYYNFLLLIKFSIFKNQKRNAE